MKISLVNPPQLQLREPLGYIPLGLAYLASSLIKEGFDDVRIDNLADSKIGNIKLDYADIFCITYMSVAREEVKKTIKHIREEYSESKIIVGGPCSSVDPIGVYIDINPDVVMTGEGEKLLPKLIKYMIDEHKVRNITHAGIINDLDKLEFPARELFDYDNIVNTSGIHGQYKGQKATTIIGSRGCPYSCNFCCRQHPMYSNYRYRSAENIRDELIKIKEDYGIEHVRFVDDCFTLLKDRVKKICEYTRELDISFVCITRADACDLDMLKTLKNGGCTVVNIGVESGSDRLLLEMNKRETVDQMKSCILNAKKVGLKTKVLLQYDLPGETEEDWNKTIQFLKETKPDYYTLSKFNPLPGSRWSEMGNNENGNKMIGKSDGWFYDDNDNIRNRLKNEIEDILCW